MSRLYDALLQAGLPQIFKAEPSEELVENTEDYEPLDLGTSLETAPTPLVIPIQKDSSFHWNEMETFYPDALPQSRLVALSDAGELGTEKFRLLRARLRHMKSQAGIQSLVITSAVPEDGKSLVALNLAMSLSQHTEQKVLLIEGDLHKPVFAGRTGLRGRRGLSEWLSGDTGIEKHLYQMKDSMLWVLPAGVPRQHPLGMLQSKKFSELIEKFKQSFDWIVIDAPPMLPLADVNFWSQHSDGILLVVREGKTPKRLLKKGLETLDAARILGVVLNDSHVVDRTYYERYYRVDHSLPKNGKVTSDE